MSEVLLEAHDLTVLRCRSRRRAAFYGLVDTFGRRDRASRSIPRSGEFSALQGVSLQLSAGEAVGVIGHNGAGKSTLLKCLAGILQPTSGNVRAYGPVESVIELGSRLSRDLSGRENASLGGLLRGKREAALEQYVAKVADFSELGRPFDQPVRTYSSGMIARLAFAMAAMNQPKVLLIDEALAVGDIDFQKKCLASTDELLARGGALLLVSHNLLQIQSACSRALLLEDGQLRYDGTAVDTVRAFVTSRSRSEAVGEAVEEAGHMAGISLVRFGNDEHIAVTGQPTELIVEYSLPQSATGISWGFELWTADQQICVTSAQDLETRDLAAGRGRLACTIYDLPVAPGSYSLRLNLTDRMACQPLIVRGFGQGAMPVKVQSPPSIESNYQVENGQIAVVSVAWARGDLLLSDQSADERCGAP